MDTPLTPEQVAAWKRVQARQSGEVSLDLLSENDRLRAALREVKSIAEQAAIYAVGKRPQLDPGARFDLIAKTVRSALSN